MQALGAAIRAGLVRSCHDLAEGVLAVAGAEMALAGQPGLNIDLRRVPHYLRTDCDMATTLLFSESPSRFLVEVAPQQREAFEHFLNQRQIQDFNLIGVTNSTGRLQLGYDPPQPEISLPVASLQAAWKGELA